MGSLAMHAIYLRVMQSLLSPHGVYTAADVEGALARVFGAGVRPLHLEAAVFEAMLASLAQPADGAVVEAEDDACQRDWGAAVCRARGLLAVAVACVPC